MSWCYWLMSRKGQDVAFGDGRALHQGEAIHHLTELELAMALLSAEGASRHAQDQAIVGRFTPKTGTAWT
jgi:hypothetical protein